MNECTKAMQLSRESRVFNILHEMKVRWRYQVWQLR